MVSLIRFLGSHRLSPLANHTGDTPFGASLCCPWPRHQISRTFLYQLLLAAHLQLEVLFSDEKLLFQKDHRHLEQLILLLRLAGKCALLSIATIVKALEYPPNAVGYLSQFFHSAGQALPSTLVMPSKTLVFYLSDEIFALHAPILLTIDAHSTTILNIELAADRSAETWKAHFDTLQEHHFSSIGMASDRGLGLVAGYRAACDTALWVADYFHEFRDLFEVLHQGGAQSLCGHCQGIRRGAKVCPGRSDCS
jgi:hypothetical protein